MAQEIENQIKELAKKASITNDPIAAQQFAQAGLSLSQAYGILKNGKKEGFTLSIEKATHIVSAFEIHRHATPIELVESLKPFVEYAAAFVMANKGE